MSKNSFGTGIIAFAVIICILAFIGAILEASTPKCIKSGCNNERASGSSYCYLHKTYPKSNYSSSAKTKSSSSGSNYTSKSSGSSSDGSYESKGSGSSSGSKNYSSKKSSSSSSSSSKRKYYNSYDDGYDDIYENDDYDEDRYRTDPDYASGVDDAMEDVDW